MDEHSGGLSLLYNKSLPILILMDLARTLHITYSKLNKLPLYYRQFGESSILCIPYDAPDL